MRKSIFFILTLLCGSALSYGHEWKGETSLFHGYTQYDFSLETLKCKIVEPKQIAEGNPWIWRARFWGHEPGVDIALLENGFHVAYVEVGGLFGSPEAVARWDVFYDYLTSVKGFSKKPALEGMSRGGLIVYNWAVRNPNQVACIYADAPVCDFKSWPGGKGVGNGAPKNWKTCLKAYGLNESEALAYSGNPVDSIDSLAVTGVPLLHVVGDTDVVVPVAENTAILAYRYKALGGSINVIHKPRVGHHPHGLEDPSPIVDFILKYANVVKDPIRIACVGDSITFGARIKEREMNSYPMQLGRMLGDGYVVENFGVSGATLLKKGNKPYWNTNRFKQAHDFNPDIVIIKLGTNDSKPGNWALKDTFVPDYVSLIESFRSLPNQPAVYVCKPVPAFPGNFKITDSVIREGVIPAIEEVANQADVDVIDLYATLSGRAKMFPDKIHPNHEGARVMAEHIAAFLETKATSGL